MGSGMERDPDGRYVAFDDLVAVVAKYKLDAERYRWFRDQPMERKVWIAEMSDEGHLLDHHIDKGLCGL
jgi:hypothetical protein